MNKLLLYIKIRKFYNIFGSVVGANFITKLSDMSVCDVYDVLFDINEALEGYDDEADEMTIWLNKLQCQILDYCDKEPLTLNSILFNICNTKKNGFYELRRGTKPIYAFAQWLYKKGVI